MCGAAAGADILHDGKVPYLYVTGASFSGSTLLAFLLNAHPRIVSFSEMGPNLRFVTADDYRCSCGELLLRCPFFLDLQRRVQALGSEFSLRDWKMDFTISRHRPLDILLARPLRSVLLEDIRDPLARCWPGYRDTVRWISRRVYHLARAALEMTGKEVFADVQKDSMRVKFLSEMEEIDLRVVHLIRDVRGSVVSFMKNGNLGLAPATRRWLNENMNSERVRRFVPPDRWMRVHYEALCKDPQSTMNALADYIGVERAVVPKNIYDTTHHILGNRMRLGGSGKGSVRLDESWRQILNERDLRTVARLSGTVSRSFGSAWPPVDGSPLSA